MSDEGARPKNLWVQHARSAASGLWVWRWPVHSEGQQQKQEKDGHQAGPQPAAPADASFLPNPSRSARHSRPRQIQQLPDRI